MAQGTLALVGDSVGGLVSSGVSSVARFKWAILIVVGLVVLFSIIWFLNVALRKKNQWTHKIKVQRLLSNGQLTKEEIIRARRFIPEKGVEMFELEKPLIGSLLCPQPGAYSDINTFSIVLDEHNRIYTKLKTTFNKDKESENISIVHAGIDVSMQQMKDKWQSAHKQNKKLTALELINAGMKVILIISVVIILTVGIGKWAEVQAAKTAIAASEVEVMENLAEAMDTLQSVVNTQQLQLVPMIKSVYGTDNIQKYIEPYCEVVNVSS